MSVFADSSALVKRYADEHGWEVVRSIVEPLVVSQLARVEVPAALWRKQRIGELSVEDAHILVTEFEFDLCGGDGADAVLTAVAPIAAVLDRAARLAATHGLRAYDCVQLASAIIVRDVDPECRTFAAFDDQLRGAAATEGFTLLP